LNLSLATWGIFFTGVDLAEVGVRTATGHDASWLKFRAETQSFLAGPTDHRWIYKSSNLKINRRFVREVLSNQLQNFNMSETYDTIPTSHKLINAAAASKEPAEELFGSPVLFDFAIYTHPSTHEPVLAMMIRSYDSMPKFRKPKSKQENLLDRIKQIGLKPTF
jgi:hypothetical protein